MFFSKYAKAQNFKRLAPLATSAAVPFVFCITQERPVLCSEVTANDLVPRHLINRMDILCKCWSNEGGFDDLYELEGELGHGGFGTVYKARLKGTSIRRAVKRIDKGDINVGLMENELTSLVNLDHPHIVKLIRYFDEKDFLYFIFELCTGPDLLDAMNEVGDTPTHHMSEYEAAVALRHILKSLKCCHGRYVGHYDIKPENFMYQSPQRKNLKMIDLGMSSGFTLKNHRFKGTANYSAPEIFRGVYGPEADVWSCGVILFMMLTGDPFFPDQDASDEELQRLAHDRKWVRKRVAWAAKTYGFSSELRDLLNQMLSQDRHRRITVKEALKHPFVQASLLFHDQGHGRDERAEATDVLEDLVQSFEKLSKQSLLQRAALLLMAHLVGYSLADMSSQRLAFRMLDQDGDGELSVESLQDALYNYNIDVQKDLEDLFSHVDTDGDGYISFLDFLSATLPSNVRYNKANVRTVFSLFDKNGDGFIDAFELIDTFDIQTEEHIALCHDSIIELHLPPYNMPLETNIETYFLPKRLRGVTVARKEGPSAFLLDNTELKSKSTYLAYRTSKDLESRIFKVPGPKWGSIVEGEDEGDWIKVQHTVHRVSFEQFYKLMRSEENMKQ